MSLIKPVSVIGLPAGINMKKIMAAVWSLVKN